MLFISWECKENFYTEKQEENIGFYPSHKQYFQRSNCSYSRSLPMHNNQMEQTQKQISPIVCAALASTHLQNFTEVFELIQKEKISSQSRDLRSNLILLGPFA